MKIYLNAGRRQYKSKPKNDKMPEIQKDLAQAEEISLDELAQRIQRGTSFRCAALRKKEKKEETDRDRFLSQQLFGVDIDNKDADLTPEQAIDIAVRKGYKPALVYPTFSDTEEKRRFRIAFLLDAPITDLFQRDAMQKMFFAMFNGVADEGCKDCGRIFFGTNKKVILVDASARISTEKALKDAEKFFTAEKPETKKKAARSIESRTNGGAQDAIKRHDFEYFRRKYGEEKRIFKDNAEFFKFLYSEISLASFLEVPEKKAFCCIMPEHDDKTPSASVFKNQYGIWNYKCFSAGCIAHGRVLTIKTVVEHLGKFNSAPKAVKFLRDCFNAEIIETPEAIEAREILEDIRRNLLTGSIPGMLTQKNQVIFAEMAPTAWKNISGHALQTYLQILTIADDCRHSMQRTSAGELIISIPQRRLVKAGNGSKKTIAQDIGELCYHKLLRRLPDTDIPPKLLKAADAIRDGKNRTAFYGIPSFAIDAVYAMELRGQLWRTNGYRKSALSYELILRTDGQDIATEVYPQYSVLTNGDMRKPTEAAEKRGNAVEQELLSQIQRRGYASEADIVGFLSAGQSASKKKLAERTVKVNVAEIMAKYNLEKVRANKELKERFKIICNERSYPAIIIPVE